MANQLGSVDPSSVDSDSISKAASDMWRDVACLDPVDPGHFVVDEGEKKKNGSSVGDKKKDYKILICGVESAGEW